MARRCIGNRVSTSDRDTKMLLINLCDELDVELREKGFVDLGNLSESQVEEARLLAANIMNRLAYHV